MKEDYCIDDLVFQKEGSVVYRVYDKNEECYALTLLSYPETIEGDLTESVFLKSFRDLKALKHPSLRELTEGGFDDKGKQIWLTNLWGKGDSLEDIMQERPIGTSELMRLKENGDDLIASLGDRADCLTFDAREIFIEKAANGLITNSFVIDYWQWFHHWITGSGFGGGKDAGDEILKLMTSLADQMPVRKKAPEPLKTGPLINKPIIVLPDAPETLPEVSRTTAPEPEAAQIIQMPGAPPAQLQQPAPAVAAPEVEIPAPEQTQPAAATPEPPKTRRLLVAGGTVTPPQPAQPTGQVVYAQAAPQAALQVVAQPIPPVAAAVQTVPAPVATPATQITATPSPQKTRMLVTGDQMTARAVAAPGTTQTVAAPAPQRPRPATVIASSSGSGTSAGLVIFALLAIVGVIVGVTLFQQSRKDSMNNVAAKEPDLPINRSTLDEAGGVLNDPPPKSFTAQTETDKKLEPRPAKIDHRKTPPVADIEPQPANDEGARSSIPDLPVPVVIQEPSPDHRPHPTQITELEAANVTALKSKVGSWVRVQGIVTKADSQGAWVFKGSGLRAILRNGQMRDLDQEETVSCTILGWLVGPDELDVQQEFDIKELNSGAAAEAGE